MKKQPVAIFDSGIGGLPYLSWVEKALPQETLIYLADTKNFPYGEKTPEEVQKAVILLSEQLVSRCNPKLLLVACNTASTLALEALRQRWSFPVVGVVPAVKKAAEVTQNGKVAVLATSRTIEGVYLAQMVQQFCQDCQVIGLKAPDLVELVEENRWTSQSPERKKIIAGWSERIKAEGVDTVVLGCTHFLHLAQELSISLGPSIKVIDSREGVGRRAQEVLATHDLLADARTGPNLFYYSADISWTKEKIEVLDKKYQSFAKSFALDFGGAWVF